MHPLMGADVRTLVRSLTEYGGVPPRNWLHLAAFLAAAIARSPITLLERLLQNPSSDSVDTASEPVFIVGHWRSGTTHLHNLLSRSPEFGIITPLASGLPNELLTLATWLRPLLEKGLPEDRGVDRVAVTPDSPQEDEIPLANMQPYSVFHACYYPKHFQQRFQEGVFFEGVSEWDQSHWERQALRFYRKVQRHQHGLPPLIKNPVYTARINRLLKIWPKARFIHIYRNPYVVYASTVHYFRKLLPEMALQDFSHLDIEALVLDIYPRMMSALDQESTHLPPHRFTHVRFEDLETNPLEILESLHAQLGIPSWDRTRDNLRAYLEELKSYKKNRFTLSTAVCEKVEQHWAPWIQRWGYERPEAE